MPDDDVKKSTIIVLAPGEYTQQEMRELVELGSHAPPGSHIQAQPDVADELDGLAESLEQLQRDYETHTHPMPPLMLITPPPRPTVWGRIKRWWQRLTQGD